EDVAQFYARQGVDADVALSGNVVEIRVTQDWRQLQRGGSLWARVGPYIYVFSPATKELFETWGGVAAVRAITVTANGEEVARALLPRDALNDVTWRRSLNLLGTALQQGTERPSRLEDLVEWGEEYTEHQYSPEYVPECRGGQGNEQESHTDSGRRHRSGHNGSNTPRPRGGGRENRVGAAPGRRRGDHRAPFAAAGRDAGIDPLDGRGAQGPAHDAGRLRLPLRERCAAQG